MNPDHVSSHYSAPAERKANRALAKKSLVANLIKKGHTRKRAMQMIKGKL